jgi:hypothetical protein
MKIFGPLILLICVLFSTQASANITVKVYEEDKAAGGDEWKLTQVYIDGIGAGFQSANASLRANKQQPLFCQPTHFITTSENLLHILDQQIAKGSLAPMPDDALIELVLLVGLQKMFPCH